MQPSSNRRIFGSSISLQFLLFAGVVVFYNRLVYHFATPSAQPSFSTWAAPLYARAKPVSISSWAQAARLLAPVPLTVLWIMASLWCVRAADDPGPTVPPRTTSRHLALTGSMVLAFVFVIVFNVVVAMMDDGVRSIASPFSRTSLEYFGDVAKVDDLTAFLRDYPSLPLAHHSRTHPPGGVVFLWLVSRAFGPSIDAASLAAVFVSALTLIPATMLFRRIVPSAGTSLPRSTACFVAIYALTPNLVLFGATSMDGVFAFVLTCTMYAFAVALDDEPHDTPRRLWLGALAGVWLAVSTFMTYASVGLVVLFGVDWIGQVVDPSRRRHAGRGFTVLCVAALTFVLCFVLLRLLTGCDIVACAHASIARDDQIMKPVRAHILDMATTNLLAILVGSGMIVATLWLRSALRHAVRLSAGLGVTLVLLSVSRLFTRETERVWMFLTPLMLAGAAHELCRLRPPAARRRWLVASLVLLATQTWVTQLLLNTFW